MNCAKIDTETKEFSEMFDIQTCWHGDILDIKDL